MYAAITPWRRFNINASPDVASATVQSANYAMNLDEAASAGGGHANQPHVYQKIKLETRTCMHVTCQEEREGDAEDL